MIQDRALQFPQFLARLDTELVDERPSSLLVGLECFRLPARPVERQHQLRVQALAVGMLAWQRLELADQLGIAAERELRLDPLLDRGQTQLLEPGDLRLGERLVGEVGKRRAAPERQRLGRQLQRPLGLPAASARAPFLSQASKRSRSSSLGPTRTR